MGLISVLGRDNGYRGSVPRDIFRDIFPFSHGQDLNFLFCIDDDDDDEPARRVERRAGHSCTDLEVGSGATSFPPYAFVFPVVRLRGLPFNCSDIDIFKFFAGLDIVDVLLVSKNGKFSGEAFVVFAGPMQVEIALQRDRHNMGRRYVEVFRCYKQDYYNAVAAEEGAYENEVRASPPPAGPSRAKRLGEKDKLEYTEVLKMRGLPYSVNKPQIIEFFGGYKLVEGRVHVVCRPDGKATGEAFVEFETAEESRRAMAKDKMSIGSRYVELFPSTREEARRAESRSRQ